MDTATALVLTDRDHALFIEQGFIVVKDVVPRELIEQTVAMLDASAYEGKPGTSSYKPVRSELIEECITDRLLGAVCELIGDGAFTPHRNAQDRPREFQSETEWRNEGSHVDLCDPSVLAEGWAVGVFLALTAVPSHGGAFMYAPGSPRVFRAMASRRGCEWIWSAAAEARGGDVVEFLAEPGDAILFQHLMCHGGSINTSNPQTRRVLDIRFPTVAPLCPGEKPFADMSTLEKASSMRYLASTFGAEFVLPDVAPDGTSLRDGFAAAGSIRAQVAFRWEGATYLAHVTDDDPTLIRLSRTTDWANWSEVDAIESPIGPVAALHFDARYGPTLTLSGEARSAILSGGDDLQTWTTVTLADRMRLLRQRYVILDFRSQHARDQVAFYIDPDVPHELRWRSRSTEPLFGHGISLFAELASWESDGVACTLADGAVFADALITATRDLQTFALVADLPDAPAQFEISELTDVFTGNLRPLCYETPTPPTRIRIYERARDVWLVTYLRDGRVFWGVIYWSAPEPAVRELAAPEELRGALGLVGLR